MALTKEAEQACFDAFNALFVADTVNANGLANVTQVAGAYTSNAVLVGNVVGVATPALARLGDPQRTGSVPLIEWDGQVTNEGDTMGYARAEMIVRLRHWTNRETPAGFGSQNPVVLRSRQVFHRAAPAATGGWTFSMLHRHRGFQAPSNDKRQLYITEYGVIMNAADGDY
jgi:hypothetical protein